MNEKELQELLLSEEAEDKEKAPVPAEHMNYVEADIEHIVLKDAEGGGE